MSIKHYFSLLVIGLSLAACTVISAPPQPSAAPTATHSPQVILPTSMNPPSPSPALTEKPTSTPSPTRSPTRITGTMVPSPTATLPPTRIPPLPTANANVQYRLVDWTPDRAEALIAAMIQYPEGLEGWERSYRYASSFVYASLVEAEAVSRFPSDPRAAQWLWDSAYHRTLQFNPDADQIYGKLIVDSLDHGETDLAGLKAWFENHAPTFDLVITPLQPLPGLSSSQVLLILPRSWPDSITAGGVFLWLVSDSSGFSAYPIRDFQQFETGHDGATTLHLVDLTGDGIPEAITEYGDYNAGFNHNYVEVFDLSQVPPRRLAFEPELDATELELMTDWETANGTIEFRWDYPIDDPTVTRVTYRWDGQVFKKTHFEISFREEIETQGVITDTITYKLLVAAERGDFSGVEQLKTLLASFPLSEYDFSNNPFPADVRDELRFRLGLAMAFYEDADGAIEQMQNIVDSPVVLTSTWITPAQQFLEIYHQPEDLPAACMALNCDSFSRWLPDVLSILPPTSSISPLDLLSTNGEEIYASGSFDFDQNGTPEYWAFADNNHQYSPLQIIYTEQGHYQKETLFIFNTVTNTATVRPTVLSSLEGIPIYSFDADNLHLPFVFFRSPDGSIQVMELSELVATILSESEEALLAGTDAISVRNRLAALQFGPYFETCEWGFHRWDCLRDHYLYLYGLAQELAGDRAGAAATYLELWQSYPHSPYAIMAQAKLEPVP